MPHLVYESNYPVQKQPKAKMSKICAPLLYIVVISLTMMRKMVEFILQLFLEILVIKNSLLQMETKVISHIKVEFLYLWMALARTAQITDAWINPPNNIKACDVTL